LYQPVPCRSIFFYLEKLVHFDLSCRVDIDSLDGGTNLVVGLSLANILDDFDKILLVNLAASINVEATEE